MAIVIHILFSYVRTGFCALYLMGNEVFLKSYWVI